MSLAGAQSERVKFSYLLQLAQEQIKALETDDHFSFERILASRRTLIDSFIDPHGQVEADPALKTMVMHIQECDKTAMRLLYRKMGKIMRLMSELQQNKKARQAYESPIRRSAPAAAIFQPDASRFLDQKS
jgi:hypothetical protein